MNVKLLAEHHLEFLSLKGGCTGLSESTLVQLPHCWNSHVVAHIMYSLERGGTVNFWKVQFQAQMVKCHQQDG